MHPLIASSPIPLWLSLGGLLVAGIIGYVIVMRVRKDAQSESTPEGFTLENLRELQRAGKLSLGEFNAASAMLKGRIQHELKNPPPVVKPTSNDVVAGLRARKSGR
ncbi:MAG: hypothetical protein DWH96_09215 [Planctomycetota bacterium]|nr:MAG: hypothetical protein DWH96_09215 [Planctomycetota bacterium]RLS91439.1 MAG: hypothetical protein DWI11_11145 [Planctomycetota bacterium]